LYIEEDTPIEIVLSGRDSDNDPITYSISDEPNNGTLTGVPPNLTYTPNADFNGLDRFVFTVDDGQATRSAVVSIEVAPVNDAPIARNDTLRLQQESLVPAQFQVVDTDINDDLQVVIVTPPTKGSINISSLNAMHYTYQPNDGEFGRDRFVYQVRDSLNAQSELAVVHININAVGNTLPSRPRLLSPALDGNAESSAVTFEWNKASDVNGDALDYELVLCRDENLLDCEVHQVADSVAAQQFIFTVGGSTAGLLMIGLVGAGANRRRKLLHWITIAVVVVILNACSDATEQVSQAGPGKPGQNVMRYTVTGLEADSEYFWRIAVDDGRGGYTESEVRSFRTN
jgi:hypothetical protein